MTTYDDFRREYEQQHPASVPVPPRDIASAYPGWLRWAVIGMFICAALISGVHTVPTIYAGIEHTVDESVRRVVSLSGFVAVELAIFVAAYARLRGNKWTVTIMLCVVFGIALVSNLNSVLKALAANGDFMTTVVGVMLGFGMPLVALLAGEVIASQYSATKAAEAKAWASYRDERRQFDAIVLREFRKQSGPEGGPAPVSASARTGPPDSAPPIVRSDSGERTDRSGFGYNRTADAHQKVLAWLDANPDQARLSLRTLEGLIGVSKTTIGEARNEWEHLRQPVAATNGSGSNGHRPADTDERTDT